MENIKKDNFLGKYIQPIETNEKIHITSNKLYKVRDAYIDTRNNKEIVQFEIENDIGINTYYDSGLFYVAGFNV